MAGRKKRKSMIPKKPKAMNKGKLRGRIMDLFRSNSNKVFNYKQVSSRLDLSDAASRRLTLVVLNELAQDKMLMQPSTGKFKIAESQLALIEGVIDFSKGGQAYVMTEKSGTDIIISRGFSKDALHGDKVVVSITGGRRGQPEGKVVKVLTRAMTDFVGVIEISEQHAFVVPTNPRIHVDFFVPLAKIKDAKNGQKVIVRFLEWKDLDKSPISEVIKVLGDPGLHDVEMHAILAEYGLPLDFPEEVERAANEISVSISNEEIKLREDFRNSPTFTIDPDDAKDFDDALSVDKLENGNYLVGVHIADVSHYVKPGSIIDKEAVKRATSVYLVDRVVPMLPEILSNYVCSLRPDEEKLTMSAIFEITKDGKIKKERFGKTIIKSNRRFTYAEAQAIIDGADGDFKEEIMLLNKWAEKMREARFSSGALEFSGSEVKFKLDENGKPIGVFQKVMGKANFLIEEFMLLANRQIATYYGKSKENNAAKPFVYRIHDLPDEEKLQNLKQFVARLGYKLTSTKPDQASRSLNQLMHQIAGKTEEDIVKQMSIRTMAKAVYSTENIGHYGLAFDYYTHFTSPIRRYPDVLVHRLVEAYKSGNKGDSVDYLERLCKHSSAMEKKATDAERASIKYKQVEFMIDKIGQIFSGSISGLTRWGIYVELDGTKIEGMVPLNSMSDDVYRFDERTNTVVGTRYKEVYEFGDKVNVEVKAADLILKQLDFRLA
jgi:ribonuclease R